MTHSKYIDKLIQSKLEQLPRGLKGDAPKKHIDDILEELDILKNIKEIISIYL